MIDLDFDRRHIWHPYASMKNPLPVFPVSAASGVRLHLEDGRELVDGMSSWWAAVHGYNHPVLNRAAREQLRRMSHVMFGGLTHEPAVKLARQLVAITPDSLDRVFFSDSGSVAVEIAIKMAVQYWGALSRPAKKRMLALRCGYHGDTFGAMSVSDPLTGMHSLFRGAIQEQLFAPSPECRYGEPCRDDDISAMVRLLEEHHHELAAAFVYRAKYTSGLTGTRLFPKNN